MAEAAEEVAEPELGKNVVHLRTFGKSSSCEKFLCHEMSKYKNPRNLANYCDIRTEGGFGSYPRIILQFLYNEIPFMFRFLLKPLLRKHRILKS